MVLKGPALFVRITDAILNERSSNLQLLTLTLSGLANFIVWGITNQRVLNCLSPLIYGERSEFTEVPSTEDLETAFATVDETGSATDSRTEATRLTNFAVKPSVDM